MKTLDRLSFKSFHKMHHFKTRKITERCWEFVLWGHIWKQGYGYLGLLICIYETLPKFITYHRQKKKKRNKMNKQKTNKNFRKCRAHNSSLTCLFIYTSYHFSLWVFSFTVFWLFVCFVLRLFFFFDFPSGEMGISPTCSQGKCWTSCALFRMILIELYLYFKMKDYLLAEN